MVQTKLAAIYARMFDFYRAAISWYMQSSFGRLMRSFNENLMKEFEDAKKDLEVDVVELYREVAIANTAIVAMVNGRVRILEDELHRQRRNYEVRDMLAGQRMERILQATWTNVEQVKSMIASATLSKPAEIAQNLVVDPPACGSIYNPRHNLDAFIIDKEQPGFSGKANLWVSEKDIIHKLRLWMTDNTKSRTLWISSPFKPGVAVPSCRAAVMATIAAAWQAETPIISYSCSRPSRNQLRPGMNVEQVGMISLVYGFIRQLSQFSRVDEEFENHDDDFAALNGEVSSWDASLRLLKMLLRKAPVVTFCVIENLNDLEWNNGGVWCKQLLDVLRECQQETGISFNILYSTTGQSRVLPAYVSVRDRHMTSSRT
ncbi:hypothetical protein J4E85_004099 [Alternaria conjuncta]|uniref:uncharacterized protein n=1 Tax=Alternaria conjuncta TaxID=181017 RepID=UPI0022210EDA|nr:uncharacterized protein J4E85_004099 [Alternaria conjuncta]KAI4931506.1 hypothetical protein J4E85_004099 [Alternaria conjuncta]